MQMQIDQETLNKKQVLDLAKPPVKALGFVEYPKMIYKHPKVAFRQEHKDVNGKVQEVTVPTEHLTKLVSDKKKLEAAKKEGWREDPYIPAKAETIADPTY